MSLQRQYFHLSYLKTLCNQTRDLLPIAGPILKQPSELVDVDKCNFG